MQRFFSQHCRAVFSDRLPKLELERLKLHRQFPSLQSSVDQGLPQNLWIFKGNEPLSNDVELEGDLLFELRAGQSWIPRFWVEYSELYWNLDQLAIRGSSSSSSMTVDPVPFPSNLDNLQKMSPAVGKQLAEMRVARRFTSNWWLRSYGTSKHNLVVSSWRQRPCRVTRKVPGSIAHISQLKRPEELVARTLLGVPGLNFRQRHPLEVEHLKHRPPLELPLYLSKHNLLMWDFQLKPDAVPIKVPAWNERISTNSLDLHHTHSSGEDAEDAAVVDDATGLPMDPLTVRQSHVASSSSSAGPTKNVHFYNIDDVKLPPGAALASKLEEQEAALPHVPLDGITGEPLLSIPELVNRANIQRNVWFSAEQLLGLRARCGVNAVPVVAAVAQRGSGDANQRVWYHVSDLVDASAALRVL